MALGRYHPRRHRDGAGPRGRSLGRTRWALPVVVVVALVIVGVVVLLTRGGGSATASSSLYLVPAKVPVGFHLTSAIDRTAGSQSGSQLDSNGTDTTAGTAPADSGRPVVLGSLHFLYGDPVAADPLGEPAVAVWVTPDQHDLQQADTFGAAYDVTAPRQVTRGGRTISVRSLRLQGSDGAPLYGAAVVLPGSGAVTVWGRNLAEDRVVQLAASIPDVPSARQAVATGGGSVPSDSAWREPILGALPAGSRLLLAQREAAVFPVQAAARLGFAPEETSLTYGGGSSQEPPRTFSVDVRVGDEGLVAADRFFLRSEPVNVGGRRGWVVHWPVAGNPPAAGSDEELPTVEWVRDGHVVRVMGSPSTLDQVMKVAESLHEVSADEWHHLLAPLRRSGVVYP